MTHPNLLFIVKLHLLKIPELVPHRFIMTNMQIHIVTAAWAVVMVQTLVIKAALQTITSAEIPLLVFATMAAIHVSIVICQVLIQAQDPSSPVLEFAPTKIPFLVDTIMAIMHVNVMAVQSHV
jgi:hypothetical protein